MHINAKIAGTFYFERKIFWGYANGRGTKSVAKYLIAGQRKVILGKIAVDTEFGECNVNENAESDVQNYIVS